jgi:hypothetical protein
VCACLAVQFAFFSRADSGVLLTAINEQVSDSTFSINQAAKNVARNQAAPSSRVSSGQDDPDNCFNKLQLRWTMLRNHQDTDLYWFFDDDPASKNSDIITEWLLLLLVELDIPGKPLQELNGPVIPCVVVELLQRTPSACRLQSSWFGAYGSLSSQHSSTSTSLYGRLQKLSSSSATCLRASIFRKRHSFDKLRHLL